MLNARMIVIGGVDYEILGERSFGELERVEITLRRPRGRRMYHAVRYEDGSVSEVV